MKRILALVFRLAVVPVGVVFGLWTAQLRSFPYCPPGGPCPGFSGPPPTFALWQCALFGASVALVLLLVSRAGSLANALRVASVPVGVGVGFWTAWLTTDPNVCPPNALCLDLLLARRPTFATWQCVVFGAGAAAFLLLLSVAVARFPGKPSSFKLAHHPGLGT